MVRILQINVTANNGSTGRIAEGIGNAIRDAGFESRIAWGRVGRDSSSRLIQIGNHWDCRWHGLESRLLDNHGQASRHATGELIRQMEAIKPDIVHLHNIHGYYLNYPTLFQYLSKKDIPIVWTLHDCWSFTGHCTYFDYIGCNKWQTGCNNCPQGNSYPASWLFDRSRQNWIDKKHFFTMPRRMTLVPVSRWLAELVQGSFLNRYPFRVIHNGIDIRNFRPHNSEAVKEKYGWQREKILLGVASVWSSRKGLADFVKLANMLPSPYRLVLVGLSKKQMRRLPENMTAIPRTESIAELAELYSVAEVFINPTWEDNFPTTNLESIACGTPVITYRTGGSVESIRPDTGIIVEQGDLGGVLNAVNYTTKNVENCRNYALKHFRQEDRFLEYVKLYQEILQIK
ncbi:glycosyltransferase [Victivallis sp. Marseille-Q1083]|uniref:glycosyltransferase n=1 Tax=Victivallis sp. Marseille-Q1083 TaxID=2717288 RepID=UPI00158C684E|nr:glycosyltransferase [Victivallis sp. Marseille-Q1083]